MKGRQLGVSLGTAAVRKKIVRVTKGDKISVKIARHVRVMQEAELLTYVFVEVLPGPVPLPRLDAPLRNDLLVVHVARGQRRRGHQGDAAPAELGSHDRS